MPWRGESDPYKVLVSEIMLQQTQVTRVIPKYERFIKVFPGFKTLARSSLASVITEWSGLGYNRRARLLRECAQKVTNLYGEELPRTLNDLRALPGVGVATAGSLSAFAFNLPVVFIETNIRSVFIYFFFPHQNQVTDKDITQLVELTLDRKKPREWYYALMDYGAMLKRYKNPNTKSSTYKKQGVFRGSNRQVRGMILKVLAPHDRLSIEKLNQVLDSSHEKITKAIDGLKQDGLVECKGNFISIRNDI